MRGPNSTLTMAALADCAAERSSNLPAAKSGTVSNGTFTQGAQSVFGSKSTPSNLFNSRRTDLSQLGLTHSPGRSLLLLPAVLWLDVFGVPLPGFSG